MPKDGAIRRWNYDDADLLDEDESVCADCGKPFQLDQEVQERPAFSLRFYHVNTDDCER